MNNFHRALDIARNTNKQVNTKCYSIGSIKLKQIIITTYDVKELELREEIGSAYILLEML